MKLNKSALTLIVAALLPASVYAGTDAVNTSFERGMLYCEAVASTTVIPSEVATAKKADPLEDEINAAINSTSDPVLASYYRDLYRAPAVFGTAEFVRAPDPLVDAISVALYGTTERGSTQLC
jgi:hypothetical protein